MGGVARVGAGLHGLRIARFFEGTRPRRGVLYSAATNQEPSQSEQIMVHIQLIVRDILKTNVNGHEKINEIYTLHLAQGCCNLP